MGDKAAFSVSNPPLALRPLGLLSLQMSLCVSAQYSYIVVNLVSLWERKGLQLPSVPPRWCLNPLHLCSDLLSERVRLHKNVSRCSPPPGALHLNLILLWEWKDEQLFSLTNGFQASLRRLWTTECEGRWELSHDQLCFCKNCPWEPWGSRKHDLYEIIFDIEMLCHKLAQGTFIERKCGHSMPCLSFVF